jgi:sigma-B regulation protein RsbU (phosphoserine phosphatase)
MRVLIADDDPIALEVLSRTLTPDKFQVTKVRDGGEALELLMQPNSPALAILDWMMPTLEGPQVCRALRAETPERRRYLILLTSREAREDVVAGLEAGADDYLAKPFHKGELLARVSVGARVLDLQEGLAARVAELQEALSRVKVLSGLLPICSYCKSIRSDKDYWQSVESYIGQQTDALFSHGICPPCFERISKELDEYDITNPPPRGISI